MWSNEEAITEVCQHGCMEESSMVLVDVSSQKEKRGSLYGSLKEGEDAFE